MHVTLEKLLITKLIGKCTDILAFLKKCCVIVLLTFQVLWDLQLKTKGTKHAIVSKSCRRKIIFTEVTSLMTDTQRKFYLQTLRNKIT